MTADEAVKLRSFKNYCNCGGYGGMKNTAAMPHESWSAQRTEWLEWYTALPDTHPYKASALKERR
jgi:hypothetical protein